MTPPIRWIERDVLVDIQCGVGFYKAKPILQYQTDTGEWVDVPVVGDGG